MTWASQRKPNYEDAKPTTTYTKQRRPFQTCSSAKCPGWEWVSNQRTCCRVRGCNAALHPPPPERAYSRPRRPRRERSTESGSHKSATSVPDELLQSLQAQLPLLQQQFPALAKSLQQLEPPTASPAAVLYGAQSACQKAFKELQVAETQAANLEIEVNDMLAEVRDKIQLLSEFNCSVKIKFRSYSASHPEGWQTS